MIQALAGHSGADRALVIYFDRILFGPQVLLSYSLFISVPLPLTAREQAERMRAQLQRPAVANAALTCYASAAPARLPELLLQARVPLCATPLPPTSPRPLAL